MISFRKYPWHYSLSFDDFCLKMSLTFSFCLQHYSGSFYGIIQPMSMTLLGLFLLYYSINVYHITWPVSIIKIHEMSMTLRGQFLWHYSENVYDITQPVSMILFQKCRWHYLSSFYDIIQPMFMTLIGQFLWYTSRICSSARGGILVNVLHLNNIWPSIQSSDWMMFRIFKQYYTWILWVWEPLRELYIM